MEHTVDNEVAYRLSQGWRQVSFEQFKAEYAAIGYTGTFSRYRVFESVPHQRYVYGLQHDDNGYFFDTVIPNYFDPDEFPVKLEKDDYF